MTITLRDPAIKPERSYSEVVTTSQISINLVASAIPHGLETLSDSGFVKSFAGVSPGALRCPGGTVTEAGFGMTRPDGPGRNGLPLIARAAAKVLF